MIHAMLLAGLLLGPQDDAVRGKIESMRVDVNFEEATLEEVVEYFREVTGLQWIIDPAVECSDDEPVSVTLRGVRLISALRVILRRVELASVVREGSIVILNREDVRTSVVTEIYDVRDLFVQIRGFAGPQLELRSQEVGAVVIDMFNEPEPPKLDPEMVVELIEETTGGESWSELDGANIEIAPNGLLMVSQTKDVHRQIRELVQRLRWFK
jgi:hypothetical protein